MSEQSNNNPVPLPQITEEGRQTIKNIFLKYNNIEHAILQQIILLIRKGVDENAIIKQVKITKNKFYRYLCYWMVKNRKNIWAKVPPRKRGKNNYNKYNEKIQDIIRGLDNCFNITGLCKDVGLSHQTMVKYLYRLMYLERKTIFA